MSAPATVLDVGMLFTAISTVLAGCAFGVSLLTFLRFGKWRKDDRTEITIKQLDEKARQGVVDLGGRFDKRVSQVDESLDRLNGKLDAEVAALVDRITQGDGEMRNSLQRVESKMRVALEDQGRQLATLLERAGHQPTQADLMTLASAVAAVGKDSATNGAKLEGLERLLVRVDASLSRLEEHHLRP